MSSRELALAAKARGNSAFSERNFSDAVKAFSEAIQHDNTDHVFFSNRSACYAELGEYQKALEDAEQCVSLAPSWVKGYSRKGLALFKLGKYDDAKKAYEEGLKYDPENEQLKEGIQSVKDQTEQAQNPFASLFGPDIWMKIKLNPRLSPFLDDPDFVNKVNLLQQNPQAIGTMLGDPKIKALFGALIGMDFDMAGQEGDREDAGEPAEETPAPAPKPSATSAKKSAAPEKKPEPAKTPEEEKADASKEEGNKFFKLKQYDEAIQHYLAAHEILPENPVYISNIAASYLEAGNNEKAIEYCEKVLELRGTVAVDLNLVAKAYARLGHAYTSLKKYEEAISAFEKSLVEKYDRKIELKKDKLRELKKKLDFENYIDPEKSLHHKEEGNKHFQEGKWVPAIEEYSEAIRRNPSDPKIYSNRAAAYVKLMEWGKALDDAEKALSLDPSFVKAYLRKAKIQFFLKQYHKAIETYKAGLAIDPNSDELKEGLDETRRAIAVGNMSGEADPERQKRAMEDPEVQAILRDPSMQAALQQMQTNPAAAQKLLADPDIRSKFETLVAAGVLQVR
eukprot:TRINITY_DN106_c0_g1_i1.p1 TRINITY_DN106_c0_g1~~TRINITY_DN106_c0_g1_i1.p1  ORF type:complete len:578 (+),score=215.85 TRINITY_DN106_c0_g1_i1:41-1735(+)